MRLIFEQNLTFVSKISSLTKNNLQNTFKNWFENQIPIKVYSKIGEIL